LLKVNFLETTLTLQLFVINKVILCMNFLAHVYLSEDNFSLAVGNLIADRVKGKDLTNFSPMIQKGILLHRKIDVFTDHHPLFKECVSLLFPIYRHYSRVIVDMYFDHFLASNWNKYHSRNLKFFSNEFYDALKIEAENFLENLKNFSKSLIFYNWFDGYKTIAGLKLILAQMEHLTRFQSKLSASTKQLKENYMYFNKHSSSFMEEVIDFTKNEIKNL